MKFYESLGYRGWANLEMGDDLNEKNRTIEKKPQWIAVRINQLVLINDYK